MEKLIITLEATCDMPQHILDEYDLKVIDMDFLIEDRLYNTATDTVVSAELYAKMKKGAKTSTSQINAKLYEEFFQKYLDNDCDILHLAFSSGLSGTGATAVDVAEAINKTSKNKIHVVDTLCACSGQGLIAMLVRDYAKTAQNINDVIEYTKSIIPKIAHIFTVDNLKYLANGGRVKGSTAFIGNLLNIKPVMHMDDSGHLVALSKVISRRKSLQAIVDKVLKERDSSSRYCFISHADCVADANYVYDLICSNSDMKPIICDLGPIIGSHSGPGTLAVFYLANNR